MVYRFTGVVQLGDHLDTARISLVTVPGQAQRIIGLLRKAIGDKHQAAVGVRRIGQLGHALITLDSAMVTIAIANKTRGIKHIAHPASLALSADICLPGTVAAGGKATFHRRPTLAIRRKHLDHATGVVAIDRRHWPAHHLNALGAIQVESRRLALTVRH